MFKASNRDKRKSAEKSKAKEGSVKPNKKKADRARRRWKLLRNILIAFRLKCSKKEKTKSNLNDCSRLNCPDGSEEVERRLSFLGQQYPFKRLLTETTRTLSMDTHYPDSVDDYDTMDEEDGNIDEEAWLTQQQLSAEATKIEKEFLNVDY